LTGNQIFVRQCAAEQHADQQRERVVDEQRVRLGRVGTVHAVIVHAPARSRSEPLRPDQPAWHGAAANRWAILARMATVPPARHLLRAKDLADARYFEALTVEDMARAAGLSRAHFSREFRRAFGEPPHVYLLTRRLERAAALLRGTDRTVVDVCVAVGLDSVGSFTTSFTRMFGRSPTAYRAAHPPAADRALIPACVLRAYGRPQHRTFREDAAVAG
jgi:AraC-like DNA-binding protein